MQDINPLLLVLEKSEQILSLVNLPDSTIKKYNELKELTCKKLNIEFFPLRKSSNLYESYSNTNNNFSNCVEYIVDYRNMSYKKSLIIDFLVNLLKKAYDYEGDDINQNLFNIINKYTLLDPKINNYTHDLKLEEENLHNKISNIQEIIAMHINLKKTQRINFDNIKIEYEEELKNLNNYYMHKINNLNKQLNTINSHNYESINDKSEKNKKDLNEYIRLLKEIHNKVDPIYKKFNSKNVKFDEDHKIKDSSAYYNKNNYHDLLSSIDYLNNIVNKFYCDNKYLINKINLLDKQNENYFNEHSLPYVSNSIVKNDVLLNLKKNLDSLVINKKAAQKKFKEIFEYIDNNLNSLELSNQSNDYKS